MGEEIEIFGENLVKEFVPKLIYKSQTSLECIDYYFSLEDLPENFNLFFKIKHNNKKVSLKINSSWIDFNKKYSLYLFLNKLFNSECIYTDEFIYLPLNIICKLYSFSLRNKPLTFSVFYDENIKLSPTVILIDSDKSFWLDNLNIDIVSCGFGYRNPSMTNSFLLCGSYKLHFLIIFIEDTFIENETGIYKIEILDKNNKNTIYSLEDLTIKSLDVYYNNNYISGYAYILNFTELSDDEFLEGIKSNTLPNSMDYKLVNRVKILGYKSSPRVCLFKSKYS